MNEGTFEPLDIEDYTRWRIEQAAEERAPRKPRPEVYLEPERPAYDMRTVNHIQTYLNRR